MPANTARIDAVCFFITIAVPTRAVAAVCTRHATAGMSIDRTLNRSALEAAGPGWTPLLVTGGGCSCGWYVRPNTSGLTERIARARAKYERAGWSPGKIARALEAARAGPGPHDGLHGEIVSLLEAIASRHGAVGVWVHDFVGKVEQEPYGIAARERWTLSELAGKARTLDTDVLAEITA